MDGSSARFSQLLVLEAFDLAKMSDEFLKTSALEEIRRFGRVLHNTIHFYLKERMSWKRMTEKELLKEYEERWTNEGFFSREHEEMRKKAGEKALLQFYLREEDSRKAPGLLEKNFRWQLDVRLLETRLYFLESDIVGHAQKKEKELERAVEKIKEVKAGVLSQGYRARPDWHNCSFCEFRTICPDSYAY